MSDFAMEYDACLQKARTDITENVAARTSQAVSDIKSVLIADAKKGLDTHTFFLWEETITRQPDLFGSMVKLEISKAMYDLGFKVEYESHTISNSMARVYVVLTRNK